MRIFILSVCIVTWATCAGAQEVTLPESPVVQLRTLIKEAAAKNASVSASVEAMTEAEARIPGGGWLDPPLLTYERKEMPGFDWGDALYSELELMQMIRLPGKSSAATDLLRFESDHVHHEHMEVVNDVLRDVKVSFHRLWFSQQAAALDQDVARQLDRLYKTAAARYGAGLTGSEEMLMTDLERSRARNRIRERRAAEVREKARLMQLLNRAPADTIGYAVAEEVEKEFVLDTLIAAALRDRPMLLHDSISIEAAGRARDEAGQQWLPDLLFGVSYMDGVRADFSGWSLKAGITLPFMPWSLPRASSSTEAADAGIRKARDRYQETRTQVVLAVTEAHASIQSLQSQLKNFTDGILPLSERAMRAALSQYESGSTPYLLVHTAVLEYVRVREEYFTAKLELDTEIAMLEHAIGGEAEQWSMPPHNESQDSQDRKEN